MISAGSQSVLPNTCVHGSTLTPSSSPFADSPRSRNAELEVATPSSDGVGSRLGDWMRTTAASDSVKPKGPLAVSRARSPARQPPLACRRRRDRVAHRHNRSRPCGGDVPGGRRHALWDRREHRADLALPRAARAAVTDTVGGSPAVSLPRQRASRQRTSLSVDPAPSATRNTARRAERTSSPGTSVSGR